MEIPRRLQLRRTGGRVARSGRALFALALSLAGGAALALPAGGPRAFGLSVSPNVGIQAGSAREILYNDESPSKKNSLLEWRAAPLFTLGADARANFKNLFIDIGFSFALPVRCGDMRDSDYSLDGTKIAYSLNEETARACFDIRAAVSYRFALRDFFSLSPKISALCSQVSFKAENGRGWYGFPEYTSDGKTHAWNDEEAHRFPDGSMRLSSVEYVERSLFLFAGVDLLFDFARVSVSLSPRASVLTLNSLRDERLSYTETGKFIGCFNAFALGVEVVFKINRTLGVKGCVDFLYERETRGERRYNGRKASNEKGTSIRRAEFSLAIVARVSRPASRSAKRRAARRAAGQPRSL